MPNIDELRHDIGVAAEKIWHAEGNPHRPFGFSFMASLTEKPWSIEVHPRLEIMEETAIEAVTAKLVVSKVTHTGQLEELIQVRI